MNIHAVDQIYFLTLGIALVSLFYATAGQAGGTAFLSVMALASIPAASMRPTALFLNIIAAAYATWALHRRAAIDWKTLLLVTPPSLMSAFAGGLIELGSGIYLRVTGILLVLGAAMLALKPVTGETRPFPASAAVAIGTGTGFLSGLTGVGGGTFLAPLLIVFGWASPKRAAAISPPFILCNSILGLAGVLLSGQALPSSTWIYGFAALAGAILGARIGYYWMSERSIRYVLTAILLLGGLRLILR